VIDCKDSTISNIAAWLAGKIGPVARFENRISDDFAWRESRFHIGINRNVEPFAGFFSTFVTLSRAVEGGILAVILPLFLAKSYSQGAVRLVSARRL
jgi:hypothetical protein